MVATTVEERRLVALQRSLPLATADVVEAVYQGEDQAFRRFVGLSAIWLVVDVQDGIARLAPHSLLVGGSGRRAPRSAPLTDFHMAKKVAKLVDEAG